MTILLKKFVAISLLCLLLFNWFGYRLWTFYIEEKADSQQDFQPADDSYDDDAQLISLKVPLTNLSYYLNSKEFERVDGKIEIGGVQYKYVKRRIYHDSLEVLCVPDQLAIKLKAVKNEFFRFANDLQHTGQGKRQDANRYAGKHFSVDYYQEQDIFQPINSCVHLNRQYSSAFFTYPSIYALVAEHPPEQTC